MIASLMAAVALVGGGLVSTWASAATAVQYEAEDGALSGGAVVEDEHDGHSGIGYVGGYTDLNRGTASTEFAVDLAGPSESVELRYANGTTESKTLTVSIDEGPASQFVLPATSSWDDWATTRIPADIGPGAHTVAITFAGADSGNVNLDHLTVNESEPTAPPTNPTIPPTNPTIPPTNPTIPPTTPTAPGDPVTYEAEGASLSGGTAPDTEHPGYTGSAFVSGYTDANSGTASTEFTVDVVNESDTVDLRYANGNGDARTLTVSVDGATGTQFSLAPTSSWSDWSTTTLPVTIASGPHTVAIAFAAGDNGNVNIDSLTVTEVDPTVPPTTVPPTTVPPTTVPPTTDPTVPPTTDPTVPPTTDPTVPPTTDPTSPPNPPTPGDTDQAETIFSSGGATVDESTAGFDGSGYVTGFDQPNARVIRTVSMPSSGNAAVALRTASPNGGSPVASLVVNGRPAGDINLSGDSSWNDTTVTLALRTGLNTIQVQGTGDAFLLDSIAVAGDEPLQSRGATVPSVQYEAEAATTNGRIIAPDRTYETIAAESSGRSAVVLESTGDQVDFTLTEAADAITLRFSIPDSADGRGADAPLSLYADGEKIQSLELTSIYSWVYGAYPYNNDPSQGGAHRFYDEIRAEIGSWPAGTELSLRKDAGDDAESYTIDLLETEVVPDALSAPDGAVDITDFGARSDDSDSTDAIRSAIGEARSSGAPVWIPEGTFRISNRIEIEQVTILGAGTWQSAIAGTGGKGGFFVNDGPVTLADFAILGDNRVRDDANFDAAIEGDFGEGSFVQNIWIEHTKVGMWIDSGTRGLAAVGLRIRNTWADGVNMHADVIGAEVSQTVLRNTGDDALAMWSDGQPVTRSAYRFNTVQVPVLANGIGIYGGNSNSATDNVISDTVVAASGIAVGSRFNPVPLSGTTSIARNTLVRTGSREVNWQTDLGALWFYADTSDITAPIEVRDMDIVDTTFQAVLISYQREVSGLSFDRVNIDGTGTYGFELNSAGSATVDNTSLSGTRSGAVLDQQLGFDLRLGSGNSGF